MLTSDFLVRFMQSRFIVAILIENCSPPYSLRHYLAQHRSNFRLVRTRLGIPFSGSETWRPGARNARQKASPLQPNGEVFRQSPFALRPDRSRSERFGRR